MPDGQFRDFFEYWKIPPFEKYSEYVQYWIKDMSSEESEEYARFIDADRLIRCYSKGELEQTYDGWGTGICITMPFCWGGMSTQAMW